MRLTWIIHRTPMGNVHALGSRVAVGRTGRRWQVLIQPRLSRGRRISFGWGERP